MVVEHTCTLSTAAMSLTASAPEALAWNSWYAYTTKSLHSTGSRVCDANAVIGDESAD